MERVVREQSGLVGTNNPGWDGTDRVPSLPVGTYNLCPSLYAHTHPTIHAPPWKVDRVLAPWGLWANGMSGKVPRGV